MNREYSGSRYCPDLKSSPFHGAPVYAIDVTGSTMDDAEQLLDGKDLPGVEAGIPVQSGTVLRAEYQTAGRGRLPGRTWNAAAGDSCLFTLLLHRDDAPFSPGLFPLLAGLALQRFLQEEYDVTGKIKWPNDLLVNYKERYRKLSGILCRKREDWYLLGIGINCSRLSFGAGLSDSAVSLRMITGSSVEPSEILYPVLSSLRLTFSEAAAGTAGGGSAARTAGGAVRDGGRSIIREIEKALLYINENATLAAGRPPNERKIETVIRGIGENGELLYAGEGGEVRHMAAGEVALKRRTGAV